MATNVCRTCSLRLVGVTDGSHQEYRLTLTFLKILRRSIGEAQAWVPPPNWQPTGQRELKSKYCTNIHYCGWQESVGTNLAALILIQAGSFLARHI